MQDKGRALYRGDYWVPVQEFRTAEDEYYNREGVKNYMAVGKKYKPGVIQKTWRELNKTELPKWATNIREESNSAKAYCYIVDRYDNSDKTTAAKREEAYLALVDEVESLKEAKAALQATKDAANKAARE